MARAHNSPTVMGGLLALALTPAFWPGGALAQDEEVVACDVEAANLKFETQDEDGDGQPPLITVGDVNVCNDEDTLTVTFEPSEGWCLLATDLTSRPAWTRFPDPQRQAADGAVRLRR